MEHSRNKLHIFLIKFEIHYLFCCTFYMEIFNCTHTHIPLVLPLVLYKVHLCTYSVPTMYIWGQITAIVTIGTLYNRLYQSSSVINAICNSCYLLPSGYWFRGWINLTCSFCKDAILNSLLTHVFFWRQRGHSDYSEGNSSGSFLWAWRISVCGFLFL